MEGPVLDVSHTRTYTLCGLLRLSVVGSGSVPPGSACWHLLFVAERHTRVWRDMLLSSVVTLGLHPLWTVVNLAVLWTRTY